MNKKLLFTMPLVALLASCGSIGGNSVPDEKEKTRVDLPDGGEVISSDSEEKAGLWNTLAIDAQYLRGLCVFRVLLGPRKCRSESIRCTKCENRVRYSRKKNDGGMNYACIYKRKTVRPL